MPNKNFQKLEQMLSLINEGLTKEDFVRSFENVVNIVKDLKQKNEKEFELIQENLKLMSEKLRGDTASTLDDLKKQASDTLEKLTEVVNNKLANLKDGQDSVVPGPKGDKGDPGEEGSPDTPEQVRDKLETLNGNERLDISAVKGLGEALQEPRIQNGGVQLFGGTSGVKLYVNGVKKGTVKTINLIAGTNITLTHTASSGRNDILIDASGGAGGFTVLTATGSINSNNAIFTFASKPAYLISDGAWYRENFGWTWDGGTLTATLTIPPNNDIYGLV